MDLSYTYLARDEYKQRVREAEKAYQRREYSQPSRLSLIFKNIVTLVSRF
jgi:hypothetical protein